MRPHHSMQARVLIAALDILTMCDAIGMSFGMPDAPREEGNNTELHVSDAHRPTRPDTRSSGPTFN
jgi:hypothetical protein